MLPLVFVAAVVLLVLLLTVCNRGPRITGPSWFEIAHDDNRAARRARR